MICYITTNGIGNAWVEAEAEVMERKGVAFEIHSLRPPHQNFFGSESAARRNRATRLIYPLPMPAFVLSVVLAPWLFGRRFFEVLGNALFAARESARARVAALAHAFVACHWARGLRGREVDLIHAQWIHSSGTVGMYGAWLLDSPFSFTGHAVDLFRDRVALKDKIRRADFIICISEFHREFFLRHGARPEQLHIVHCGIDAMAFDFRGPSLSQPPRVISVGRLVEKKGFHVLIDACRVMADRGTEFECVIAGDGPMEASLREQVARLGLEGRVVLTGRPIRQEDLPGFLAGGDVFAQPCVWSSGNDVDGTPRTLMEAMACGVPSVSSNLAGIPDVVEDGRSGLLVEPGDVAGLADALRRTLENPALADRLSRGGREQILAKFQIDECLDPLFELFRARVGTSRLGEGVRATLSLKGVGAP